MQLRLGLPGHATLAFWNTKEGEADARHRMRNIVAYDAAGDVLTPEEGARQIGAAADWLRERGFAVARLDECLRLLGSADEMLARGFYQ